MSVEALREQLIDCVRGIAAHETSPREGAARIWVLLAEADYPSEFDEFRIFVGAVSEIEDHPEHTAAYEADIVGEARHMAARYGVR